MYPPTHVWGTGLHGGTKATHTPTPTKPVDLPAGFPYPWQSLVEKAIGLYVTPWFWWYFNFLVDHRLLDAQNFFDFLYTEAITISKIWDTFLEITRDISTRHLCLQTTNNYSTTSWSPPALVLGSSHVIATWPQTWMTSFFFCDSV